METRRASLRIKGRVQGVFFRESARQQAQRLGLLGFVRNLTDGDVEAVAEGPPEVLEQFIDWCRRGPPSARVDEVSVTEAPATHEFHAFLVER